MKPKPKPKTRQTKTIRRAKPGTTGAAGVVEPAREYVVDVPTAAGLTPFGLRGQQPQHGIPLGVDPNSGHLAGYDPLTAFLNGYQRAAQFAILAANGTGKSLLAKKLVTGFAGQGIPSIIPFDAKNEYTSLVDTIGGTTLTVDRTGGLNALDPGGTITHATKNGAPETVLVELRARRNQLVAAIAAISRGTPLAGWEQTALAAALDLLPPGAVLDDLADVFATRHDELATAIGRTTDRAAVLLEPLTLDIAALANGAIGQAVGTHAPNQRWTVDQSLVIDTSTILATEPELTAAVTITCWTAALSAIYYHNATQTDRVFAVVFDEIWRATREFPALANQIGGLLRMDRNDGIISILATHSWTDTNQPGGSNILARCAAFAIGGMQNEELDTIADAGLGLNPAELDEIRANATAGTTINGQARGGTGRFLIKTGDHPGRLIQTILTPTEQTLYNTNQKWRPTTTPNPPQTPAVEPEPKPAPTATLEPVSTAALIPAPERTPVRLNGHALAVLTPKRPTNPKPEPEPGPEAVRRHPTTTGRRRPHTANPAHRPSPDTVKLQPQQKGRTDRRESGIWWSGVIAIGAQAANIAVMANGTTNYWFVTVPVIAGLGTALIGAESVSRGLWTTETNQPTP